MSRLDLFNMSTMSKVALTLVSSSMLE